VPVFGTDLTQKSARLIPIRRIQFELPLVKCPRLANDGVGKNMYGFKLRTGVFVTMKCFVKFRSNFINKLLCFSYLNIASLRFSGGNIKPMDTGLTSMIWFNFQIALP
jgi:hypothetical protein